MKTMLKPKAVNLDAARMAEASTSRRAPAAQRLRRSTRYGLLVTVLAGIAGCDSRFADVLSQTTFAGSRTVIDLTLTYYANALAGLLDLLRG